MSSSSRDHALDALRGFAMMLGILLHAALAYMYFPLPTWPIRDEAKHLAYDLSVYAIHSFRMQVFMLLAGFFGCLLYRRSGLGPFLRHRWLRIGVPLVVAALLVQPQIQAITLYQETREQRATLVHPELKPTFREYLYPFDPESTLKPSQIVAEHFKTGGFLRHSTPMHLWFLYYLCFLYAMALASRAALGSVKGKVKSVLRRLLDGPAAIPILMLSTVPLLYTMKTWQVDSSSSWIPVPRILIYYFWFFSLGWYLYEAPDLLAKLSAPWRRLLVVALVALPVAAQLTALGLPAELTHDTQPLPSHFPWIKLGAILAQSVFTWATVFGSLGLFQAYLSQRRDWVRYLADASYWCYLMSLTPVLLLQIGLAPFDLPGFVKFSIVVVGSLAILLVTYQGLVRYTFVGTVLHGKKSRAAHPRLAR